MNKQAFARALAMRLELDPTLPGSAFRIHEVTTYDGTLCIRAVRTRGCKVFRESFMLEVTKVSTLTTEVRHGEKRKSTSPLSPVRPAARGKAGT